MKRPDPSRGSETLAPPTRRAAALVMTDEMPVGNITALSVNDAPALSQLSICWTSPAYHLYIMAAVCGCGHHYALFPRKRAPLQFNQMWRDRQISVKKKKKVLEPRIWKDLTQPPLNHCCSLDKLCLPWHLKRMFFITTAWVLSPATELSFSDLISWMIVRGARTKPMASELRRTNPT